MHSRAGRSSILSLLVSLAVIGGVGVVVYAVFVKPNLGEESLADKEAGLQPEESNPVDRFFRDMASSLSGDNDDDGYGWSRHRASTEYVLDVNKATHPLIGYDINTPYETVRLGLRDPERRIELRQNFNALRESIANAKATIVDRDRTDVEPEAIEFAKSTHRRLELFERALSEVSHVLIRIRDRMAPIEIARLHEALDRAEENISKLADEDTALKEKCEGLAKRYNVKIIWVN